MPGTGTHAVCLSALVPDMFETGLTAGDGGE
jgi:hypothetical protein